MTELDVFKKIKFYLDLSNKIYSIYLTNNKSYIFARLIFEYNNKTRDTIIENIKFIPNELIFSSQSLIIYYDIWLEKWNDLNNSKKFKLFEVFAFENEFTFPKLDAEKFENHYLKIINKS